METVANMFDRDGSGLIDYKDFVNALKPDREPQKPITDTEKINDEVKNQVSKCTCVKQFKIHKIGEGKYRVSLVRSNSFNERNQIVGTGISNYHPVFIIYLYRF